MIFVVLHAGGPFNRRICRVFLSADAADSFFWGGLDVFSAEPADRQVLFVVARGFFYPQITQINA
ncbi:MAG TPA: hypothetical protein PLE35_06395, partial [Lentisphaeria bacterium]|nr:hypothetical protein [Lentisphaeria bacterium]